MSNCGEWEQFVLMGSPYAPALYQYFDYPLVGIFPLVLLEILPFIQVNPHFDLSQSCALTHFLLSPTLSSASSPQAFSHYPNLWLSDPGPSSSSCELLNEYCLGVLI